ncbi:helix-turn-helix domain-containing protein [Zobellia nedashkovskayae]|uniref:helix-turn-helix domain-containing protein n=1 Tax=Zobellia nedashkovskayae TaxID=2779510 RepID=UPI00188C6A83|nr:helix-turn-helix domain-containing protein [Zobellia nedashkovskayae]
MQLTEKIEQHVVYKIKDSETFKNAPTSRGLLQYLYEATKRGEHLKEAVIELEFFRNDENQEKNNPRVRVNIYNLRKKLTAYYETEGSTDSWQLKIDKGQYKVRFIKRQAPAGWMRKVTWSQILPYGLFLVALIMLVVTNISSKTPLLWESFLNSEKSTNLILGDHFGTMGETMTGGRGWTRDFEINSVDEFYDLLEVKPELQGVLHPANYSYTTRMAAMATQQFQQFFQANDKPISIRFSTQTTLPEIKEGNAIYAGPIKNENQFIGFFNDANAYFNLSGKTLKLSGHPTMKDSLFTFGTSLVDQEYAIVAKYPSIGNSEHFVFFSQHDIGVSATVEYFTNNDSLQKFQKEHLKGKKYFTALFKVKGQNRVDTDLKLEMVVGF